VTINAEEANVLLGAPVDTEAGQTLLRKAVEQALERINAELASYETIKRFTILEHDFTIENGLLTPTLKVRRKAVFERYADVIEAMYREEV
jgi:long-chain acyl-CoA synthetase